MAPPNAPLKDAVLLINPFERDLEGVFLAALLLHVHWEESYARCVDPYGAGVFRCG